MHKAIKIFLYILGGIFVLLIAAVAWLNTQSGKNFVRDKTVGFLQKKLKTEVKVGSLDFSFPKMILLKDVVFKDQRNDTLLAVGELQLDISMLKLLSSKVDVKEIRLANGVINAYRIAPDTSFNFDYIVAAFSSPPDPNRETKPVDSTGQMQLDIKKVTLSQIDVRYNDYTGGDRFFIRIDTLGTHIRKVDPYHMDFRIKDLYANGVDAGFMLDTNYLPLKKADTAIPLPYLAADVIDLQHVRFNFRDNTAKIYLDLDITQLKGHPKVIDLNHQTIAADDLVFDSSTVKVVMAAKTVATGAPIPKWRVFANSLNLNQINFSYDDQTMPRLPYGIDYGHLDVQNAQLQATNAAYTTDTISGNIKHLSGQERSGLDIKELRTVFMYHPQGTYLSHLYFQTDNSLLKDDNVAITYPSIAVLAQHPEVLHVDASINNGIAGIKDLSIFIPQLRQQPIYRKYAGESIKINTALTGTLNALNIAKLQVRGLGDTYIDLSGKINGAPDVNKLNYDLKIARFQTNKDVINSFLPAAVQKQVNLPNSFSVSGRVAGTASMFNTDLVAVTSDGNITMKGIVNVAKGKEKYDLVVKTNKLNIGKITKQQNVVGSITGNISSKGYGFDVNRMNAQLQGDITAIALLGYNYTGIHFNAAVDKKLANIQLKSTDPNATLKLDAKVDVHNKYPAVNGNLQIEHADLKALNLSKEALTVRADLVADITELNPDYPRGSVSINRPAIVLQGQEYFLDSMYVTSQPNADSGNYIIVNADAIQAVISGKVPLSQIGNIVQSHISRHYAINGADSLRAVKAAPANYNLSVNATIYDRPLIHAFIPALKAMDSIHATASVTPSNLDISANIPYVQYSDMYLYNGKVAAHGDNSLLTYNISLDRLTQSNMEFWYAGANGNVNREGISSRIVISDSAKRERFAISGIYHQHTDKQELHINDGLKLDYKDWQVSQPNSIVFGKDGFYVQNFKISSGNESVSLSSTAPQYNAPMNIAISNFLISNITRIVQKDTLLANGILNSDLTIQNPTKDLKINGTVKVQDLSVQNDTIGNVDLQLAEASGNMANAKMTINGRGNDISVSGYYYPRAYNGNNFNLKMDVHALNLQSMEGLTMGQIRNSSGYIRGSLTIKGTVTQPVVTGELHTDNLSTNIAALGTTYKMPAEKIRFTSEGIEFDNFKLVDSMGHTGTISGKIITKDYRNMELALRMRANRWLALNSTVKDNKLYYGKLLMSSNLRINGTPTAPNINGDITVHDSTKLTVAIPETIPGVEERKGVVEFVDMRNYGRARAVKDTVPKLAIRSGADLNVNLTIEKNAEFNVMIDQATGDFLRVRGEAALNTTVNPDGTIGLTGVYELNQGSYELNYNFIKRRFDIQKGSTITFAGDPLDADLNVTATYTADIAPYDLVEKQVSEPSQLVYYKQRLPFEVQLKLSGPVMKPIIGFDIVLPEGKQYRVSPDVLTLVQGKLGQLRNNQTDMQKQVFAVLILNRFVSDNPFESGSDIDAAFLAKQSASRLISEQLNKFAGQLITGIDLNLDLQTTEDYTTGQRRDRTALSVAASKRLLNDRLTLTVGNDFEVESANPNQSQNNSLVPGNLAADYQLTQSGRYKVRLYRRNNLEDIVTGYVVETGASFIVTYDYNRFRDLFINKKRTLRRAAENNQNKVTSN